MKDPFFLPPVPWLTELVEPWAARLNLPTLPLHIHEVFYSALLYTVIFWPISPLVSNLLAGKHYTKLSRKKRLNWHAHVVSMVQSCLINSLAVWVIIVDDERRQMEWQERVWGYTGSCAMIQAMAAGYFVWDLFVTSFNLDVFGIGTLMHAIAALLVYALGFRPLVNYYSSVFILWELSTPFLNVHWFMDKMDMTGSKAQLYNGFALLFSFFTARLLFGTWSSFCVMRDLWWAVQSPPNLTKLGAPSMGYANSTTTVPLWMACAYLASNITLNSLNFYWFFKMVWAVRKRFEPLHEPVTEVEVDLSTMASGVADAGKPRRRKA
ncbi:hypothetical protein N3K66_006008 [Trichothecium roseum]|uniref:Uncharacterized protein n=1 Tax=Trichothecium roseum TaxID=47278 RepID=A0ACC0V160_9HYPO|nr:hypothetical protein N3K66_006008 [Trichothecium roseum]